MVTRLLLPAFLLSISSCSGPQSSSHDPAPINVFNFRVIAPGVVGAGQVDVTDFPGMAESGYSLVVNLRLPGEPFPGNEQEMAEAVGMAYVAIPMSGKNLSPIHAQRLAEALEAHGDGNALIHCGSGNRVGGLWGLYVGLRDGLSAEEAVKIGRAAGMESESLADCIRKALPATE